MEQFSINMFWLALGPLRPWPPCSTGVTRSVSASGWAVFTATRAC